MHPLNRRLTTRLDTQRNGALYRQRRTLASPQQPQVILEGKTLLSFCSNDYLGLANHPDVLKSFKKAAEKYGVGSGASHLVSGHTSAHHLLEEELAAFTGRSRALVFSSGYMANVGILTALLEKQDSVFEDRLNHASLLDGGLYSGARFKRYPHLGIEKLTQMLSKQSSTDALSFIVSDGVFSMDGDIAPLAKLMALAEQHNATLMLDDAHGFGTLGATGGGLAQMTQETGELVDEARLPILVGTFGKAFGTAGAFVAGSEELIESLIQFCRPYIYTTAMPAAIAAASSTSLGIIQKETWRREKLQHLIKVFRDGCKSLGLTLTNSQTPIQGLILGSPEAALRASKSLEAQGILVTAIRPPTVPSGTARLRITFSAGHEEADVNALLQDLETLNLGAKL